VNEEDFIELTPEEEFEFPCDDSTEELLKKYDKKRKQRYDDITAMQTVVCILLAAILLVSNLFYPEICEPVFDDLKKHVSDQKEIMPNPIDFILSKL